MTLDKRNIFLTGVTEAVSYGPRPQGGGGGSSYPERDVEHHTIFIQEKLQNAYKESLAQKQVAAIRYKEGIYLEFSSASKHDLAIKSLENRQQGIRLLNVRKDEGTDTIKATVYIPAGKQTYFLDKVKAYGNTDKLTTSGKPQNNDLIAGIEDARLAILESFWTGEKKDMPNSTPVWCEVWLRFNYDKRNPQAAKEAEGEFADICEQHRISVDDKSVTFPERIVKLILANEEHLKTIIGECEHIAEIRRAQETTSFFKDLPNYEQREWVEELLSRTNFQDNDTTVCLLDTGLTYSHPLIIPAIQNNGVHAVKTAWRAEDHHGHGTEMAGIALYGDLRQALADTSNISVLHKIESVKILPPSGSNAPELYGAITMQSVSLAEISNPHVNRTLCMAITSSKYNTPDGSPTSWSAAIDSITSAAGEESENLLVRAMFSLRNLRIALIRIAMYYIALKVRDKHGMP
jgi:hypothetical protein